MFAGKLEWMNVTPVPEPTSDFFAAPTEARLADACEDARQPAAGPPPPPGPGENRR